MFKNNSFLLLLITVTFCSTLSSKDFELTFNTGLSSFDMSSLKLYNSEIMYEVNKNIGINTVITQNFPIFLWYSIECLKDFNNNCYLGFSIGFVSTGSRISYRDYSGDYSNDNIVKSINLGFIVQIPFKLNEKIRLDLEFEPGVLFSSLLSDETIRIGKESETLSHDFSAISIYFLLKTKLYYWFSDNLAAGISLGYLIDSQTDFQLSDYDRIYMASPGGSFVSTGWSGARFGVFVAFSF